MPAPHGTLTPAWHATYITDTHGGHGIHGIHVERSALVSAAVLDVVRQARTG
ncbi:hypothetical protein [Microterricola viridarii]|uniref:hypothetical protein n=1 Tax=Microterricola viridarii TaxID=412690 RepID=UPI001365CDB2|nr:hypothetical protein [Microterricola viridarii]